MEFLRLLEGLRNPVFDVFFSLVTRFGEELVFIVVGIVFFWCIDKRRGYYILSVGFLGTVLNQFLKLLCRIPRPWVRDPSFTIVESARAEATGYSFPSGHTQSSVGVFGAIARIFSRTWVRITCLAICILVPLSRMYLGVHTPADVGVSIGIAVLLVFGLYPIIDKASATPRRMRIFLASMLSLSVLYLLFVLLFPFPEDIDPHNYASGVKNAYKILGCILGLFVAYEIDARYVNFETSGSLTTQVLKVVLGLLPLLAIKEGLRTPLEWIFGNGVSDGVRYLLLTAFAGGVWPMTFPWISRLADKIKKAKKKEA